MRPWLPVVGLVVGLFVVGYALLSAETDEERIAHKLTLLSDAVSTTSESSTNPLLRTAALNEAFEEIFTPDVEYRVPELTSGRDGRAALVRLAAQSSALFSTLVVSFADPKIEFMANRTLARATTVATVEAHRGSNLDRDERRVDFDLTAQSGDWFVTNVHVYPKSEDD